jgi:tetratricopeptide (TPR) repeat protein
MAKPQADYDAILAAWFAGAPARSAEELRLKHQELRDELGRRASLDELTSFQLAVELVALEKAVRRIEDGYLSDKLTDLETNFVQEDGSEIRESSEPQDGSVEEDPAEIDPAEIDRAEHEPADLAFEDTGSGSPAARPHFDPALLKRLAALLVIVSGLIVGARYISRHVDLQQTTSAPISVQAMQTSPVPNQEAAVTSSNEKMPETASDRCSGDAACGEKPVTTDSGQKPTPAVVFTTTDASARYQAGTKSLAEGKPADAILQFSQAIKLEPRIADSFVGRGTAYAALDQYQKAIVDFSKAILLDPMNAKALRERGSAYVIDGDPDRAIADLSRALYANSDREQLSTSELITALRSRAALYHAKRLYDSELKDLSTIIAAYRKTAADAETASGSTKSTVPNTAMVASIYRQRAAVYAEKKRLQLAVDDLTAALQLGGRDPAVLAERGRLYEQLGMNDKAIPDYRAAAQIDGADDNVKLRGAVP